MFNKDDFDNINYINFDDSFNIELDQNSKIIFGYNGIGINDKIINIFGEDIYRVKGYIYEIYCKKEDNLYTYIFPMPFADFSIMDWINDMIDSSLFGNTRFKVVCNDFCLGKVRKVLNDEVDVICII